MGGHGRVLVLTGVSGSIGTAIGRRFLADGYRIVLIDRDKPSLDGFGADANRALAISADVTETKAGHGPTIFTTGPSP